MDTIFIEDLICTGIHGVYEQEHITPQRFSVSVKMNTVCEKAALSDDLSDTLDYGKIKKNIISIIEGDHCSLLEKLGGTIGNMILEDRRVESCSVSIKKLDVWSNGTPGVTLHIKQQPQEYILPFSLQEIIYDLDLDDAVSLPLLSKDVCDLMKKEALHEKFTQAEEVYGKRNVIQHFKHFRRYPQNHFLWKVVRELEQKIRLQEKELGLSLFAYPLSFNEISTQIYAKESIGISIHRDEYLFKNLIIICVVEGEGEFYTCSNREGEDEKIIKAHTGDVIFMKAPGYKDCTLCPLHAVRNIPSQRISISFRQEMS